MNNTNNTELQLKIINVTNICNAIIENLANGNYDMAERKSWLLHEVICVNFGAENGKKKETGSDTN